MLGSGTSSGVPVIGCDCAVCRSDDPRNRRSRAGILLELPSGNVVIDTSPDFREQALKANLRRVDAVLYTHPHADHVFGLDDLRIFNFLQRRAISCYGSPATMERLRQVFAYVFDDSPEGGGKPKLQFHGVTEPFDLLGERVVPVPLWHGEMEVLGYRIGKFACVTDVSSIPESSFELLADLDLLVLSALRYKPHPTHFNFEEAIDAARRIGARRTLFTHIAHDVDHAHPAIAIPQGMEIGHDGMVVELA
jgi:phosphoribosyl 1,2-cyclic phosphate phosphodiesterase